ncbi:MAG: DUF488 domain-containing protein [Acidobacteria bacterium]|nr:DUF488 domain-containing protein [Acidobacteriota bacterium]
MLTIGHSNRTAPEFVSRLRANGVELLADIRRIPKSGRNPWFSGPALRADLSAAGIGYRHFEALGGMRTARDDSPNSAILDASFRGYADHMMTAEFNAALDELLDLASRCKAAAMCAEADPAHCHRWYLADAVVARGWEVGHITSQGPPHAHSLSPWARVEEGRVKYPGLF